MAGSDHPMSHPAQHVRGLPGCCSPGLWPVRACNLPIVPPSGPACESALQSWTAASPMHSAMSSMSQPQAALSAGTEEEGKHPGLNCGLQIHPQPLLLHTSQTVTLTPAAAPPAGHSGNPARVQAWGPRKGAGPGGGYRAPGQPHPALPRRPHGRRCGAQPAVRPQSPPQRRVPPLLPVRPFGGRAQVFRVREACSCRQSLWVAGSSRCPAVRMGLGPMSQSCGCAVAAAACRSDLVTHPVACCSCKQPARLADC